MAATTDSVPLRTDAAKSDSRVTLALCVGAALLEGFDNQSMGVAAPKLIPDLALSVGQASLVFSATTAGLFLGAALGGRLADHAGRRRVLILSMLLFGLCSLLTTAAFGPRSLFAVRLLTGLGLGGAMPNFIALASEAAPHSRRLTAGTIVMTGLPLGGLLAGLIALGSAWGWDWRVIFYVGGAAPILLALLMWRFLPKSHQGAAGNHAIPATRVESVRSALFGSGRALTTLQLWGGFFFTQLVLFLMLNWLPSLVVGLGFSKAQSSLASMCFNLTGAFGAVVLSRLHAGTRRRLWVAVTYCGMGVALAALPLWHPTFGLAIVSIGLAGLFIIGAQLILFALSPLYYPSSTRGTGVGAAVAVGRFGSIVGPLYAGALLAAGGSSATVFAGIIPFVLIGGASAFALASRPEHRD